MFVGQEAVRDYSGRQRAAATSRRVTDRTPWCSYYFSLIPAKTIWFLDRKSPHHGQAEPTGQSPRSFSTYLRYSSKVPFAPNAVQSPRGQGQVVRCSIHCPSALRHRQRVCISLINRSPRPRLSVTSVRRLSTFSRTQPDISRRNQCAHVSAKQPFVRAAIQGRPHQ